MVDRGADVVDVPVELASPGPDDLVEVGEAERDEEQPGLVHVAVVLVHHRDGRLGGCQGTAEPVGGEGAAGSAPQDHDPMHAPLRVLSPIVAVRPGSGKGTKSRLGRRPGPNGAAQAPRVNTGCRSASAAHSASVESGVTPSKNIPVSNFQRRR